MVRSKGFHHQAELAEIIHSGRVLWAPEKEVALKVTPLTYLQEMGWETAENGPHLLSQ